MEKTPFFDFLKNKKYHALLIGVVVACIHLVITSIIGSKQGYFTLPVNTTAIALIAPGLVTHIIIFLSLSIGIPDLLDPSSPLLVLVVVFSSAFYGVTVGLLASNRKTLRWLGVVFIGLLVLSNCFMWLVLAGGGAGEY